MTPVLGMPPRIDHRHVFGEVDCAGAFPDNARHLEVVQEVRDGLCLAFR
jgi:hypothetical protein